MRTRPGACLRLLLPLLLTLGGTIAPAAAATLALTVGEQRIITVKGTIDRLSVGAGDIADARVLDLSEIRVLGLKPGATDLIVWARDSGGRTQTDIALAVEPDLRLLRQQLAANPALAGLSIASEGSRLVLSGTAASLQAHDGAMALLKAVAGATIVDLSTIAGEQTVAVDIKFAAVSVTAMKELGLSYQFLGHGFQTAVANPSSVQQFSFGAGSGQSSALSVTSGLPLGDAFNLFFEASHANLATVVSALSSTSAAQLLAEPTLTVRSGHAASFLAGGEIPIPVPSTGNSGSATIEYHEYGVKLTILPTVLAANRIALEVSPEVSDIDAANALTVNGFNVPAFEKRSASTYVELGNGQSFVLAGLMYSTTQNVTQSVPGLGDLPIIGNFFRTTSNTRERQELIIIATPHLVAPLRPAELPPLPGAGLTGFRPSITDMILDRNTIGQAVTRDGLLQ